MRTVRSVVVTLLLSLCAAAQDSDDWPPLSYLKDDYKSVAVVAHVVIREAEITGRIPGYENWKVSCEVVEPFKGKFRKGDRLEY